MIRRALARIFNRRGHRLTLRSRSLIIFVLLLAAVGCEFFYFSIFPASLAAGLFRRVIAYSEGCPGVLEKNRLWTIHHRIKSTNEEKRNLYLHIAHFQKLMFYVLLRAENLTYLMNMIK